MPVSKVKKHKPNFNGGKKNAHRDKYGVTQQERDEQIERRNFINSRRNYDISEIYAQLLYLTSLAKRSKRGIK